MEHRAFAFDYAAFADELKPLLERALADGDAAPLEAFVEDHRDALKDPYEGAPLGDDWRDLLENEDVHEYGDFALTRYYDPAADLGLGYDWEDVQVLLQRELRTDLPLLGEPVGPPKRRFDPGRSGSYFQSAAQVQRHLEQVEALARDRAELSGDLDALLHVLRTASAKGLYVTF